jgi:hypothetical protein
VDGSLDSLVRDVQDATDAIFLPRAEPGRIHIDSQPPGGRVFVDNVFVGLTPMLSAEILAGRHRVQVDHDDRFPWMSSVDVPAGERLEIRLTAQNLPVRRSWPAYAAWGSGIGALLTLGGGVLFSALSEVELAEANRQQAMLDFERRQRLGRVGTGMFISAAVLAAVSAFHFLRYRDDIFGRPERSSASTP